MSEIEELMTREQLHLVRFQKILFYLESQQELNKLTKAHLNSVVENTEDASNKIFSQLAVVHGAMAELAESLLSMYRKSNSITDRHPSFWEAHRELLGELEKEIQRNTSGDKDGMSSNQDHELLQKIKSHLEGVDGAYNAILQTHHHIVDDIGTSLNQFTNDIMEALSHLQFQDITRQQIEVICQYLDDTDGYMKCLSLCVGKGKEHCEEECGVPEFNIDDILKYYVMEGQREIHYKITKGISPKKEAVHPENYMDESTETSTFETFD